MLSCFSHVWFFVTLWMFAHQAPLSIEFSMQEHWSGLPVPPPICSDFVDEHRKYLCVISQMKSNITHHLYVKPKKWTQVNLFTKHKQNHRLRKQIYGHWKWKVGGGNGKIQFSSVQSLSCVRLFVTPWTAARQASLSITNSWGLLKLMLNIYFYENYLACFSSGHTRDVFV